MAVTEETFEYPAPLRRAKKLSRVCEQIAERPSKDGNYLSLTCTFQATSREQLDALYRELTSCERVLIVL